MAAEKTRPKIALVTGGGSGIGLAIAHALYRDGYEVAILGRTKERLDAHGAFHGYACDVSDAEQVRATVATVVDELGGIDVLINNAGILRNARIEDMPDEETEAVIRINLFGTVNMTKACAPPLIASKGSIVNIGSALAKNPIEGTSIYAATKGAMESFTRAMALELGEHGVRVNCIGAAFIRSDIFVNEGMDPAVYEGLIDEFAAKYILGRVGEPEDVAELAAFLASDKASWISGAVIPLDSAYGAIGFKQG
jgi:NAD(P)-dependent dehydrogenase (short-subunit alcohol dehydrogenase family)